MEQEQLRTLKQGLEELRKTILELRRACDPPGRIAELESAIRSIRANAALADADAEILPWIVQRCDGVTKK